MAASKNTKDAILQTGMMICPGGRNRKEEAVMAMIAHATLEDGMKFVAETASGHQVVMDAHPKSGGEDSAARPLELPFAGLAGCTGMDVISILRKMRQEPEHYSIEVEGVEREEDYPKQYLAIRVTFHVKGDVAADKLERAIDLSRTRYCSVSASLRKAMRIEYNFVLNGERTVMKDQE